MKVIWSVSICEVCEHKSEIRIPNPEIPLEVMLMNKPSSTMTLEALRSVPLFSSLDDKSATELRELLRETHVTGKTRLFRAGEIGDAMYLIQSGRVQISIRDEDKNEVVLAELAQGDFFGEMSIIDGRQRICRCLSARRRDLVGSFPGCIPVIRSYESGRATKDAGSTERTLETH
jgi:hypothetical protein